MTPEPRPQKTLSDSRNGGKVQKKQNSVNQRNFRSRRKQYILELEQKVREYERDGITATMQVQAAARTVAAENTVLRSLTRVGLGWTEQELDRYISRRLAENQTSNPNRGNGDCNTRHYEKQEKLQIPMNGNEQQQSVTSPQSLPLVEGSPNPMRLERLAVQSYDNNDGSQHLRVASSAAYDDNDYEQRAPPHKITSTTIQPDDTMLRENHDHLCTNEKVSNGSSMSCEQAAAVLSGLRTQESLELIREELGCTSSSTCNVSHLEVFQRMDDTLQ